MTTKQKIARVSIDKVRPYENNARKISQKAVDKVAASMRQFGQQWPIMITPDGVIVAGHTRRLAALALGMSEVDVIVTDLSPEQARAFRIADNRTAEESRWDDALLTVELKALLSEDFELASTGFDSSEIERLIGTAAAQSGEDDAPAVEDKAVTQLGDVWVMGKHRLTCGDSTNVEDVQRVLMGEVPFLMVTDPPYGVKYDPSWRVEAGEGSAGTARGKVLNDDRADWTDAWALFPGDVAYVWHGGLHTAAVHLSLENVRFAVRAQIIWVKSRAALSLGHYHWGHEPALYAVKDGADDHFRFIDEHEDLSYAVRSGSTSTWRGGRKQSTVWEIDHIKNETGHGTQKPIDCMRKPIMNHLEEGGIVYDPFIGSGTTLIAAETVGRVCYGLELSPHYCDVIVKRWQAFTGNKATLHFQGKTFDEVAHERV